MNYEEFITKWSYEAVAISNCATIFLYCLGLLFYSFYVRSKLLIPSSSESMTQRLHFHNIVTERNGQGRAALINKLFKMHVVLAICSFCYLLRVICVALVVTDLERDETSTDSIAIFWWFTLSMWIPNLGSVSSLSMYNIKVIAINPSLANRHRYCFTQCDQRKMYQCRTLRYTLLCLQIYPPSRPTLVHRDSRCHHIIQLTVRMTVLLIRMEILT